MYFLDRFANSRRSWVVLFWRIGAIAGCAALLLNTQTLSAEVVYPPHEPLWEASTARRVDPSPELALRGAELFHIRCAECHGLTGDGNGPAAELMQLRPRDLTEGVFKFRSTLKGTMPTDEDLFRTITAGFPQYGMPSFRYLSPKDRWAIVYHVKSLSEEWGATPAGKPVDVGKQRAVTGKTLARGSQIFRDLKCTDCHVGPSGEPPKNHDLKDDWGRLIQARDYLKGRLYFKSGGRPRDIARVVLTGIPGTPMGSYADQIKTQDDLWALATFVYSMATESAAKWHKEVTQ